MYVNERSGEIVGIDDNKLYAGMHAIERKDERRVFTPSQHEVVFASGDGKVDEGYVLVYRDCRAYLGVGGAHPQCQQPSAGLDKMKKTDGFWLCMYHSTSLPFNRHIVG